MKENGQLIIGCKQSQLKKIMREINNNLLGIEEASIELMLLNVKSKSKSGALMVKSPASTDLSALCDRSI